MKTAVILSARQDKDTSVPYPLKAYHEDICLMDRTIEALTALDYTNIYLIVGGKLHYIRSMLRIMFISY